MEPLKGIRMTEIRKKAITFLNKYGMDSASTDLKQTVNLFMGEMEKGLAGPSSIAMFPTFLETDNPIPVGKKVVVIDAGGTNLRTALVSFDRNYKPVIENFKKYPMPGTGGAVSKDEFFGTLADYIADLVPRGEKIGFCFSYPTVMYPNKDGRLTKFSKEVECPDVHGEMIGENLLATLKKKGVGENPEIVILNDTVATLLTGMISFPEQSFSGYIGYIFGTGINGCYVESNGAILKQEGLDPEHSQVINTECGSFGLPPQGDIDKALDAGTNNPGSYLLEKMTSGGYLGLVVTRTLEQALKDGLFSDKASAAIESAGRLSTKDADDYIHNPHNGDNVLVKVLEGCSDEDRELLFHIIDDLTNRAARLAASALSGIVLKSGKGLSALEPLCLTVDGTTFYVSYHFKSRFEQYMREILSGEWQRYFEITRVDDAPLLGAAIAALTN